MIYKRLIILVIFALALGTSFVLGQDFEVDPQSIIADIIENIVANSEDESIDVDALAEDLIYYSENPINLNSTTAEELGRLLFLSDFQVRALLDYVKDHGAMQTIYELQLVVGFDFSDIRNLVPFITISSEIETTRRPLFQYGKHDMFVRARSLIETQQGYTPAPIDNPTATRYAGNKLGLYTRYTYSTRGGFQFGFVGEKDPGEEFFRGSNPYGFDHYSAHMQITNVGRVKSLVVGDFNADFGQGLTLWTSASFGKSPDPMGVRKRSRGIYRYSSTNENEFLRGAGATVTLGRFEVSAFGSYKKIDANITDSLIDGNYYFTSRPTSGLHRTPNEISNKKTLGEFVAGGNVNFSVGNLKAGVTGSLVNLDAAYDAPNQPYRYFEPPLQNRANLGFDYTYGLGNHLIFGEAATTLGHGSGIVSGALLRLHSLLTMSVIGRYYEKDYSTYYTGAFADGSSPANESGVLVGLRFLPYRHWQMAGYVDAFQSDWLRFGINAPSRGRDYLLETTYSPRSRLSFMLRYRLKQKDKNQVVDDEPTRWVVPYTQQALRFHLAYNPTREIHLKSRIEFSWYDEENLPQESGIMVYQDISYRPRQLPLTLTARFAVFETDSWNTRIYAYENDVLYYFSIPAYYSRGSRVFLLAKYSIGRSVDIWFRVAQTFFADQDVLGTGLDRIDGSTRSDARIQLRFKF
ncbi:ComEA family DNA-binding protein [Perlabentimonas gracilis]|uniref:ComEA family DNA-binding protein n=1 Tax=Perlabentimonas gracilis TaxID=2715279 RepID=UPI001407222A|nr:helix-hairpin-helix domain-containing protein [Perlabentimonas gracilis]NHB68383.1 helix-hairpin-helix domain-containing protein [Perlabentimonas gracilis]